MNVMHANLRDTFLGQKKLLVANMMADIQIMREFLISDEGHAQTHEQERLELLIGMKTVMSGLDHVLVCLGEMSSEDVD